MKEFIFGTLSTNEKRLNYFKAQLRGLRHNYQLEPIAPRPGEPVTIAVSAGKDTNLDAVNCILLEPESRVLSLRPVRTEWDLLNWGYIQRWQGTLPAQRAGTTVRYKIEAEHSGGDGIIQADDGATFSYFVGHPEQPVWAEDAVIYQVFPDRFHPGMGRRWKESDDLRAVHGGTIRGIIDNLPYIRDLGFNCIWLNPFFPDTTYHGYHASDYFSVNPRLGTTGDIKELVEAAHENGIRMILDFVANHWGSDHPTFREAQENKNSEFYEWYLWDRWPQEYKTFFSVKELPAINLENPAARTHILDAAAFWLQEFDFDGFRLDYALGPSLDFWTDFRAAVQRIRPDAWLFGEVVETPETQQRYWGKLHGCLDFLLQQALRQTFAFQEQSIAEFDAFLNKHETFFPTGWSRPSFLDNHDVNRFLWLVRGDKRKLKLAALCQFTLSGQPIVYYGTEAGLSQRRDVIAASGRHEMAEARLPMLWGEDQDPDLLGYYRWLIHFRREHPALWRGSRKTVHLDESAGTYAYTRQDDREIIVVALNLSDEERDIEVSGQRFELGPWGGDARHLGGV